ncbi:xylulokinase [Roseateles violae]|uniref:FGGY-family carbohydrate kinase n=1 Tax=Roseateles violae TaxID=3058042 RepID=A0ABT8DXR5_9BURK|nr:FGGY-family carbohydrate kinase [Pelomonas sp. PFR6]MDN3922365.1 FGGY-family carbohydrate kinase [Pelomonas sp. PFR6]
MSSLSATTAHPHVLAVDLGTSGCKTALVSLDGRVRAWAFRPVATQLLPGAGAEQRPEDWWQAFLDSAAELLASGLVPASRIVAVCCSTQGEGTVAIDREGRALMPAMTWMDMRGSEGIRARSRGWLNVAGYDAFKLQRWLRLTGGAPNLSGKDPSAHMLHIRDEHPEVYARTHKFLNVLDYMNLRLSGRCVATVDSILTSWVTDNRRLGQIRYDAGLIAASGIAADKFPELVRCTELLGALRPEVADALGLPRSTRVVAGAIDNTAAAIGAGTLADGDAHLYIGSSSWIGAHVSAKRTDIRAGIAAVPCALPDKYLMVAMQTSAGSNLSFLKEKVLYHRDELLREAVTDNVYELLDRIAERTPAGSDGLLYLPWLMGERCPVDDRSLRAGLFNLTLAHSRETMIRAFLEGVALNTRWMKEPVERFLQRPLQELTLLGGGANSAVWCQIFADVLDAQIRQLEAPVQANAVGAATIAFVALGLQDFETAARQTRYRRRFEPKPAHRALYDQKFGAFIELFRHLRPVYRRLNGGTQA